MAIRQYVVAIALSATLCAMPVIAYADVISDPPQQPNIENLDADAANKEIDKYNLQVGDYNDALDTAYDKAMSEVDNYNEQVDQYNKQVDTKYEQAVQETTEKNEEIEAHNQAELDRVAADEAYNEQVKQETEEQNKQIDERNAAAVQKAEEIHAANEAKKQEKVEYDATIDKEYEEAVAAEQARVNEANAVEDERISQAIEHNQRVEEQYAADLEQYKQDYAKYEKDKAMEDKILAAGYSSVDEYNNVINHYYNDPADKAIEQNKAAKDIEAPSSVSVEEATVKSGTKYNVHITHTYDINGNVVDHRENIYAFDLNDIVSTFPDGYYYTSTQPNSASFYRYISDDYLQGYWVEAWSSFQYNVLYLIESWQSGDVRTFSYKDGGKYGVTDDVFLDYYYTWISLPKYKTYDTPELPITPIKGELKDTEAHYITANTIEKKPYLEIVLEDESYELLPHITPVYKDIIPVDIWEALPAPVKDSYLEYAEYPEEPDYLEYMDYVDPFEGWADEDWDEFFEWLFSQFFPEEENTSQNNNADVEEVSIPVFNFIETAYAIDDNPTPLTRSVSQLPSTTAIEDEDIPMFDGSAAQTWALLNLIFMLITILLLINIPKRKEGNNKYYYKHHNNIINILLAVAAVILFILTENVWLMMILVDSWTIVMAAICGGAVVAKFFTRTTKEKIKE